MIGRIVFGGLALLAGSFGLRAETVVRLTLTDGQEMNFAFSARPEATLSANELTLTAVGEEPVTVSIGEVVGFDFPVLSGIEEAKRGEIFRLTPDRLIIEGVAPGTEISLFLLDGTVGVHYPADASGVSVIPRSDLPKGVTVVRIGRRSLKIMN